jgi:hypothetical protein
MSNRKKQKKDSDRYIKKLKAILSSTRGRVLFIAVLVCVCLLIGTLGYSLNRFLDREYVDGLIGKMEILVKYELWEDASVLLRQALAHDKENRRATELLESVRIGFRDDAIGMEKLFRYKDALDLYGKTLAISPDDAVSSRIEALEYTMRIPKLYIAGKPFDAEISIGDDFKERSFSRVDVEKNPSYGSDILPGNVLRFRIVAPYAIEDIRLDLRNEKGKSVTSNRGFTVKTGEGVVYNFCLLGLPSLLAPKKYILSGSWLGPDGKTASFNGDIAILKQEFRAETIVLDPALTKLVSVPDPQKAEEKRKVAEILATFHEEDAFQVETFALPIEICVKNITSYYGDRRKYVYSAGGGYTSVHDGFDYGFSVGTLVHSVANGRVVLARKHIVTGNTVIIEHLPTVYSVYYHLSEINITEGQTVNRWQAIAKVGSTGFATGPHLHLSVFVGSVAIDPTFFMKVRPLF